MNILEELKNNIIKNIEHHLSLFDYYENIYLFGSVFHGNTEPNDIDILLIYSEYSDNLIDNLHYIKSIFNNIYGLPIDFTILSNEEQKDTKFLEKLNFKYIKLK